MALRVMGVQPSEFQNIDHDAPAGYGYDYVEEAYEKAQSAGVVDGAERPTAVPRLSTFTGQVPCFGLTNCGGM